MAYATTSQLQDRLGDDLYARLTDRDEGTTASSTVAQQIIDEAAAIADSYFSRRYSTPIDLTGHPELQNIIEARVLDLAEHIAWRTSPFVSGVPTRVQALFDEALRWFEAVAQMRVNLPAASPLDSRVAEDDSPRYTAEPRAFTANELDGL